MTLSPTPLQETLPIWIGGNRPASLRRASKWDGWIADSSDPTRMTLTPDDVRRSVETIGRSEGFEVAVLGERGRGNPADYVRAGATWWLENLHDGRGSFDELLAFAAAGP